MPRSNAILQSEFPYHVTGRCINRDWFNLPMQEVWEILCRQLFFCRHAYELKIHAFVLMQNHFHLLVSTPLANLDKAMWNFMKETSQFLTEAGNRTNLTWGSRHHRTVIDSYHYFMHAYKYVYLNPVKAGVAPLAEAYPFSTLHGLLGQSKLLVPIEEDTILFANVEETLRWLNQKPDDENWRLVASAMRKTTFTLGHEKGTNRPSSLENLLF